MASFDERFRSTGVQNAWHGISASAALPPALQRAFGALDSGTRAIATALRTGVAALEIAQRVAQAANLNPGEIALREALSEIDTFLAELAINGGPTIHVLFVPLNRKKALPSTEVLAQPFRETTLEFLRGASSSDAAALVNQAQAQTAGMGGFMRAVYTSLSDPGDSRRPLFPASFATAGVCLVAGGETYADLVVPARLLTGLFDTRRSRLPLLNHVETVPQNVRVTPIPGAHGTVNAVIRWDPVPPVNQVPIGRTAVLHNEELVVVCIEGPLEAGDASDWETLFDGLELSNDRSHLPTSPSGRAKVIARLRNHGFTQSYTDMRTLDAAVPRRYVVFIRERQSSQDDAARAARARSLTATGAPPETQAPRYFMSLPSGAVWMPRTRTTSTRASRGTPPDWFSVPSVISALPPVEQALATVRTQLSRAATYTTVRTGGGQLVEQTIRTLERDLTRRAAEVARVGTVTSKLNALASSAAGVSTGLHTILLTSATGGMAGWMAALARSLTNAADPGRPIYTADAPVIGVVLVAGAPRLPELASIIALFKLLFGDAKVNPLAALETQLGPAPTATPSAASTARGPTAFDAAMRPVVDPQC